MRRAVFPLLLAALLLAPAPARAEKLKLRVVTYNVWGLPWALAEHRAQRIHAVGPALVELKPDLVALQEVWVHEDRDRLVAALKEIGLEHVAFEAEGFLGSGLVIASRYPIKNVSFKPFRLAGKLHKPFHGDAWANKGLLLVQVETPLGPLSFGNTHLHASYGSDEYLPVQITQALQIAEWTGNHGEEPSPRADDPARPPLILAGDLNARVDELPFALITARADLHPVTDELGIDWILYRDGGQVSFRVVKVQSLFEDERELAGGLKARLSDHPAVLTVLEASERPPREWNPAQAKAGWKAAAEESLPVVETALQESEGSGSSNLRRTVILLAMAGGLFLLLRRKKKKTQRNGCLFPLLILAALHASVWTLYLAVVYEPTQQNGLQRATRTLTPPATAGE